MKKEKKFWAFQITRKIIFEIKYYKLGNNQTPHFSTSASEFNQPKTDWEQCGQAQETLLPKNSLAYKFYKKWDEKHLQDLTNEEYSQLIKDIKQLKNKYNYIEQEQDKECIKTHIPFYALKDLSMLKIKR